MLFTQKRKFDWLPDRFLLTGMAISAVLGPIGMIWAGPNPVSGISILLLGVLIGCWLWVTFPVSFGLFLWFGGIFLTLTWDVSIGIVTISLGIVRLLYTD